MEKSRLSKVYEYGRWKKSDYLFEVLQEYLLHPALYQKISHTWLLSIFPGKSPKTWIFIP